MDCAGALPAWGLTGSTCIVSPGVFQLPGLWMRTPGYPTRILMGSVSCLTEPCSPMKAAVCMRYCCVEGPRWLAKRVLRVPPGIRLREAKGLSRRLHTDFGDLYSRWLEKYWQPFAFVQDAFNQYLADNYVLSPSVIQSSHRQDDLGLAERSTYTTVEEAARLSAYRPRPSVVWYRPGSCSGTSSQSIWKKPATVSCSGPR